MKCLNYLGREGNDVSSRPVRQPRLARAAAACAPTPVGKTLKRAIGLSGSTVSRGFIQASAAQLREFQERDLAGEDVVAIVLDGRAPGRRRREGRRLSMGSAETHAVAALLATNRCASRARGQSLGAPFARPNGAGTPSTMRTVSPTAPFSAGLQHKQGKALQGAPRTRHVDAEHADHGRT